MKVELNDVKVRAMATRLRDVLGRTTLGQGRALETISAVLGYKTWDLLSGMLKREALPRVEVKAPVQLYLEAFATGPEGYGPGWALLVIDQSFLDELLSLQSLCKEQSLSMAVIEREPVQWQGDQLEEGLDSDDEQFAMEPAKLYVTSEGFWLRAVPDHGYGATETRMLRIADLVAGMAGAHCEHLVKHQDVLVRAVSTSTDDFVRQLVGEKALGTEYLPI